MNVLNDYELSQMIGGGYWWRAPDGHWYYIGEDEESDGDDTICG